MTPLELDGEMKAKLDGQTMVELYVTHKVT